MERLEPPTLRISSDASQSSSSGCDGGSPRTPKSLGVATIPRPKWCCQRRFTITRAVKGLLAPVSHAASAGGRPDFCCFGEPGDAGTAPAVCEARSTPGGRGATLGPRDL